MSILNYYALLIAVYGMLDILVQKNSKTIVQSKSTDRTYLPILISFALTLTSAPFEWHFLHKTLHLQLLLIGSFFCLVAIFVRVKGQLDLKYGFSTRIEKQDKHELITNGMYCYVRHPLYLALILLLTGTNLMLNSYYSWAAELVCVYFIIVRIKHEEAFLLKEFVEYRGYMKKVKRLIPFVY
jgi:protein-S-isoprenylcysteine O-methyltransferase Ste14